MKNAGRNTYSPSQLSDERGNPHLRNSDKDGVNHCQDYDDDNDGLYDDYDWDQYEGKMRMTKSKAIVILCVVCSLLLCAGSTCAETAKCIRVIDGETIVVDYHGKTDDNACNKIIYITATGKKYHREGCRYLRKSKIPVKLCDALAAGYTPCKVCMPPTP